MGDELGGYPLCDFCRRVSGGLSTRHRQVHVRAHGRESCVDEHLTGLMVALWQVCDTTSSCADHDGRAYVVPTPDTATEAERFLIGLGLTVDNEDGALFFTIPELQHDHPVPDQPLPRPAEDPPPVAAGDLLPRLHRLEQRIATIRSHLVGATMGVPHPRILGVKDNLSTAALALAHAMRSQVDPLRRPNGQGRFVLWPLACAMLVPPIWLATLAASALSAGSLTWMLVATLAGFGVATWPYRRLRRHLAEELPRRRVRRALANPAWDEQASRTAAPRTTSDPEQMLSLICRELKEVYQAIGEVRRELAAIGRQRLGEHPRALHDSGAGLTRAATYDSALAWLLDADVDLATASDDIRLWLSLPRG